MANLSNELAAFLREDIGLIAPQGAYRHPTPEQTRAKDWYNRLNLTQEPDGSWTPNF